VLHYIVAFGIDLDVVRETRPEDASCLALVSSLLLLTFGIP
jgi:hypothetical protein